MDKWFQGRRARLEALAKKVDPDAYVECDFERHAEVRTALYESCSAGLVHVCNHPRSIQALEAALRELARAPADVNGEGGAVVSETHEERLTRLTEMARRVPCWREASHSIEVRAHGLCAYVSVTTGYRETMQETALLDTYGDLDALEAAIYAMSVEVTRSAEKEGGGK